MPTYEYECGACGHQFERFQPITARPVRTCPACRRRTVRRLLGTGGALIFKGSGFYATDYRSKAYRDAAKKEKGEAAPAKKDSGCAACDKAGAACPAKKDPVSK